MLCRSRAELPRGGRDGCVETGLPWKSSSSSASAVTAPTVRRGGWLRIRVLLGSDAAGTPAWSRLSLLGDRGCCVVLCSLKLGASLFQALLNHLSSGTRGHALPFPSEQELVLAAGQ